MKSDNGDGVKRQRVHLSDTGQGVQRKRIHLGDTGQGVQRKRIHLADVGQGDADTDEQGLYAWMQALRDRMRRVRVCCGDWMRVITPAVTTIHGLTAVFLDPPYSAEADRDNTIYEVENLTVAHDARRWALEHGDDPMFRIALCGYEGEHDMPESWEMLHWSANGGMAHLGNGRGLNNRHREVIYFSPHCLKPEVELIQFDMFGG